MKVEKARMGDIPKMHQLINYFSEKGQMLPRALSEMYENVRDFFVVRDGDAVIGCVALHVNWADLAEVKSLAVDGSRQGEGVGSMLVNACVKEARQLGLETVFCLTYKPEFFEKNAFRQVDKGQLPRKVWMECFRCPKFPDCDEVAMVYEPKGKKG